jgi:response regulator NasT
MAQARILVAEDTEIVAQALEGQLSSLGYEVVGVAWSGNEAIRLCEQLRPDLVLLNMQIANPSGDIVAQQIDEHTSTPIIMLSASCDAGSIRKVEQAGVLAYLVKPIKPEELPPAIDVALARHHELQQLRDHVDDLHETLESRKLIERAKGILMRRLHIDEREAESRIRQRAKDKQAKVKDIAQAIVDSDALLS